VLEIPDIRPVAKLCIEYKVRRLYLMGSALTDRFTDRSDIDFYVIFSEPSQSCISGLKSGLQNFFGRIVDIHLALSSKSRKHKRKLLFDIDRQIIDDGFLYFDETNLSEKTSMKITILSFMDFCGSGNKLYHALKPHHDVEIWVGRHNNAYGHPVKQTYNGHRQRIIQQRINESDVAILKGDFPVWVYEQEWKINFTCPTVTMPTGSFFRKREHGGKGRFPISDFKGYRVSSDTGLLYPEFSDIWTPMPIDSMKEPILWKQGNILSHSPTDKAKKNTAFIFRVFDGVMKRRNVQIDLIEGVSFAEAVERRKKSTIFFDQFKVGFYGNSALEAMQWGIPTACYLRPSKHLEGCPIINLPLSVDKWTDAVCQILDSDMTELSRDTKEWCDKFHSFEAVAERWGNILRCL
jgi:predicted nucleotidyltransferase